MDFDDLLVRTLELLRTRPEVLEKYPVSYTHLDVYKRQLDDIDAMGIEIEVQEVPSTTAQSYKHLREKF